MAGGHKVSLILAILSPALVKTRMPPLLNHTRLLCRGTIVYIHTVRHVTQKNNADWRVLLQRTTHVEASSITIETA